MRLLLFYFYFTIFSGITFGQEETGVASYYADMFNGRLTANGERFQPEEYTAAHKKLPFDTKVRVTNLANNKSIVVRINDRGPYVDGRIIDLAPAVAKKLDFVDDGITDVTIKIVDEETEITGKLVEEEHQKESKENTAEIEGGEEITKEEKDTVQPPKDSVEVGKDSIAPQQDSTVVQETGFYNTSISIADPKGYGVEIGSFQDASRIFDLINKVEAEFREPTIVEMKEIDEKKLYSVIVGNFPDKDEAKVFLEKVSGKYPDAFIVNFEEAEK